MSKSIIEKFEEQFGYCFNIGAVPDGITKEKIKQFLLTELKALKEEVMEEYDYNNFGWNDHRQHTKEVFEKRGIK